MTYFRFSSGLREIIFCQYVGTFSIEHILTFGLKFWKPKIENKIKIDKKSEKICHVYKNLMWTERETEKERNPITPWFPSIDCFKALLDTFLRGHRQSIWKV